MRDLWGHFLGCSSHRRRCLTRLRLASCPDVCRRLQTWSQQCQGGPCGWRQTQSAFFVTGSSTGPWEGGAEGGCWSCVAVVVEGLRDTKDRAPPGRPRPKGGGAWRSEYPRHNRRRCVRGANRCAPPPPRPPPHTWGVFKGRGEGSGRGGACASEARQHLRTGPFECLGQGCMRMAGEHSRRGPPPPPPLPLFDCLSTCLRCRGSWGHGRRGGSGQRPPPPRLLSSNSPSVAPRYAGGGAGG